LGERKKLESHECNLIIGREFTDKGFEVIFEILNFRIIPSIPKGNDLMKQILLFDADREKSNSLKKTLEDYEFDVALVEDAHSAMEVLKDSEADIIILDVETLAGDRKFDPEILKPYHEDKAVSVIFLISDKGSDFSPVKYQHTIDDIVIKPYQEQEVALRVFNRDKNNHHILFFFGEMDKLNVLLRIGSLPYKSVDLEHTGQNILKIISEVFKNESAAIFLIENEQTGMICSYGPAAEEDINRLIPVTTRIAIEQKRIMFFENLARDLFLDHSAWNRPEHFENVISIPLLVGDKIMGVIELYNASEMLFGKHSRDKLEFLEQIAGESANVLALSSQFSKVYRDLKFAADELSILYEISDALSSTLNLDELLRLIVRKAVKSFEAQVVSLMMIDEDSGELFIRHAEGIEDDIIRKTRVRIGEGVAGRVALTGQPLLLVDVMGLEAKDLIKNVKSALSVPLKVKDKVIGVINVSKNARYQFTESDLKILFNLASLASQAIEKSELYQDIKVTLEEIKSSYMNTVKALSKAIEAKDPYTQGHVDRVAKYGLAIALELDSELIKDDMFRYALVLHDIGKIQIPDAILAKKGKLSKEEQDIIRRHPETGAQILEPVKFLQKAAEMVKFHQEHWNGEGYPNGLKGEEIPLPARIIAVADAFDAITTERPYRRAQSVEFARLEIIKASGSQFDPNVVKAFLAALDKRVIP
jgi:HD-GYP domain-containing protein (c-di-GMP phosphodiesterase class II)